MECFPAINLIMQMQLNILTLNIWGIPLISKDRTVRVEAIAKELARSSYDVVTLQEVWSTYDYEYIKAHTRNVLPYAHYFYSGVAGSGLCILSKYPIITTLFHMWSVNGYVHRIQHGDWFGGKGVGLSKILVNGSIVNVYNAHLHAEYDRISDDYKSHRVVQAFETAQFIETTRGDSVLQVLAGDLNTEPGDLAYRILLSVSKMKETYPETEKIIGGTNECPYNTYTCVEEKQRSPQGKRIDYIWYRAGPNLKATVLEYTLPFPSRIEHIDCSYSDHEAVNSKILIQEFPHNSLDRICLVTEATEAYELSQILKESIDTCNVKLVALDHQRRTYIYTSIGMLILYLLVVDFTSPYGFQMVCTIFKILFSALFIFFLFMGTLWHWIEVNGILGGKLSMDITLINALTKADPSKF